jgi:hypothetical protein
MILPDALILGTGRSPGSEPDLCQHWHLTQGREECISKIESGPAMAFRVYEILRRDGWDIRVVSAEEAEAIESRIDAEMDAE